MSLKVNPAQHSLVLPHNRIKPSDLTLEAKVGQIIMAHFHGNYANENARVLLQDVGVGGIILYNFSNELQDPAQVRKLTRGLVEMSQASPTKTPPLIAIDQEGGIVSRLKRENKFTEFPGNRAVAMTGDSDLARKCAYAMGKEMRAVGITMNLAPVVDVDDASEPVIGIRSFAKTADLVTEFGGKALQGYHEAEMLTCLKHFPGIGNASLDSHLELPILNKSADELIEAELQPFFALAKDTDAIMSAHVLIPQIDGKYCATLSEKILNGIVRKKLHFKGAIISDSLVMQAVLKNCDGSLKEAAILALKAGCDLLILGGKQLVRTSEQELGVQDIQQIYLAIVDAVKEGRISEDRLNTAVSRILKMKEKYTLPQMTQPIKKVIATEKNLELADKIARKALAFSCRFSLKSRSTIFFLPKWLENFSDAIMKRKKSQIAVIELNPPEAVRLLLCSHAKKSESIVFFSYNAWKNPGQLELIRSLIDTQLPFVLIVTRDAKDAEHFQDHANIILTYSPTFASLKAAMDVISA